MKPVVTMSLLLAVILGSAVWLSWFYSSRPEPGEPVEARMPVACAGCGAAYDGKLGRQPGKCSKCGEQKAWRAQHCKAEGCGKVFPLITEDESGQAPPNLGVCPVCGGDETGDPPLAALDKP